MLPLKATKRVAEPTMLPIQVAKPVPAPVYMVNQLTYGSNNEILVDLAKRGVWVKGVKIKTSVREFELMAFLVTNPDRVCSRDQIGELVWESRLGRESNVIDVYISMLRRKLTPHGISSWIRTSIGVGYGLIEEES